MFIFDSFCGSNVYFVLVICIAQFVNVFKHVIDFGM